MSESDALALRALALLELRLSAFRYPPGARLSADRLAEETGVGRTPVRAALQWLHRDGVIGHADRYGYFVKSPSASDYRSLYAGSRALLIGSLLAPPEADGERTGAAGNADGGDELRIDASSYAASIEAIFNRISERSGSDIVIRAVGIVNLRLRFVRSIEGALIKDAREELLRLADLLPGASARRLNRAVEAYHRRRLAMASALADAACAKALRRAD